MMHYSSINRFFYSVPSNNSQSIETWKESPWTERVSQLLLSYWDDDGQNVSQSPDSDTKKEIIERGLKFKCIFLRIGHRCTVWYTMRQFSLTATGTDVIMLNESSVITCLAMTGKESTYLLPSETLSSLGASWLDFSWYTELMIRRSADGDNFLLRCQANHLLYQYFNAAYCPSTKISGLRAHQMLSPLFMLTS